MVKKKRRVAAVIDLSVAMGHHQGVFAGIARYAQEHANWDCVVQPFLRTLEKARGETGYHGVVGRTSDELVRQAAKASVPLVSVWSTLPCVLPDWEALGRMAAEHLLQRGLRRFAFQGFTKGLGTQLALASFKDVLRAAKCGCTAMTCLPQCNETARGWNGYTERLERWIGRWKPPLGVFVIQDIYCRQVANACLHAGLRIPEDVALVGFGNEPLVCLHPEPSLSSFDAGFERIGYEAAALLDRLMDGKPAPETPILVEPMKLVVRRSTDVYVVDDPLVAAALRFIAHHSHEGIRVSDVAKNVHTTVRSLERHFNAATGRTMMDEISRLRLERAKRLLVESAEPIYRVAMACGFEDVKHFHRMFRAVEGTAPREYRLRMRGHKTIPGSELRASPGQPG